MRKGISFTMTLIVSALVILGTGLLVMFLVQDRIPVFGERIGESQNDTFNEINLQQLRQQCESKMDQFCGSGGDCPSEVEVGGDQQWACEAEVDGEPCYTYWEDSYSSIPRCD